MFHGAFKSRLNWRQSLPVTGALTLTATDLLNGADNSAHSLHLRERGKSVDMFPPRFAPLNNSASCVFAAALCLYFHFVTNYFGKELSASALLRFQATSQVEEKRLGPGQKTVRLQVGLCVFKKKKKKKNKIASVLVSSHLFFGGSHRCDCVCDGVFRKGIRQRGRRRHTNRHKHRMMQHLSWWWQICCVYVFVMGGWGGGNQCLSVSPSRSLPHPASSTWRHSSESSWFGGPYQG